MFAADGIDAQNFREFLAAIGIAGGGFVVGRTTRELAGIIAFRIVRATKE